MKISTLQKVIENELLSTSSAEEYFVNTVVRLNPTKWNTRLEAEALLQLLNALERDGIIKILQ